jgi:hypothetical protein
MYIDTRPLVLLYTVQCIFHKSTLYNFTQLIPTPPISDLSVRVQNSKEFSLRVLPASTFLLSFSDFSENFSASKRRQI